MSTRCTVCNHPERYAIEHALVAGASNRDIAGRFRLSRSAVSRHTASHLPATEVRVVHARDAERAESLHDRLEELYRRAEGILDQAESAGRHNVALAGIKELRGILEFAAKLAGNVAERPDVIVLTLDDGRPIPPRRTHLESLPEGENDGA
jgi:hypothetical protein